MYKKLSIFLLLFLSLTMATLATAGKVPAPDTGGEGFKAATLAEAKKLHEDGATVIACHSHSTDFMKGHPEGTAHITCMVPKDHKRTDVELDKVLFDVSQLPADKNTPIVMYCASGTWWKSYHAARLAVKNGYTNIYWMRDGIKGWKKADYPVVNQVERLNALMALNKINFDALTVSESSAGQLHNKTLVDFRDQTEYDKGHMDGANHVNYSDMFSKPMMEELNKSNSLVIIHNNPKTAAVIAATLKLMDYPDVYIME